MTAPLYIVPAHLAADIWPSLEPHAERALAYHPFLDPGDLLMLLERGHACAFLATDGQGVLGFAAVELVDYPRVRAVNVIAAGGRRGFLPVLRGPMLNAIEAWGADCGAAVFTAQGRPGWLKVARKQGGEAVKLSLFWRSIGGPHVRRRQEDDDNRNLAARPLGSGASLPH